MNKKDEHRWSVETLELSRHGDTRYYACPVCKMSINYRAIKRHLVATHGWRYNWEISVDFPQPPKEVL